MRYWTTILLIAWFVGGKIRAETSFQSLTISPPRTPGKQIPPADVICSWARCQGWCHAESTVNSSRCSEIIGNYSYAVSRCLTTQDMSKLKLCIGPESDKQTARCKQRSLDNLCFTRYYNTTTNGQQTKICWSGMPCEDLSQYCSSNGYTDCDSSGYTTSESPSSERRDLTTTNQPITTTDLITSEKIVTSSLTPLNLSITEASKSAEPLAFIIGIVVGSLLITPIFVLILFFCAIVHRRRKKLKLKKQAESFEMNEGAVYHTIGPELPPNHPTLGKEGNPANRINTISSSRSLEVTIEPVTEAKNLPESKNTTYYVLESEQYQEGINRDNSRGTGSKYINAGDTTYLDNKIYNSGFRKSGEHGDSGNDCSRAYTQLQRNGKEYSLTDDVTEDVNALSNHDISHSDRRYIALNAVAADDRYVTDKKVGEHENTRHDITRVYTQLQNNGKEYVQTDDVTTNINELSTHDSSTSGRPDMTSKEENVDVSKEDDIEQSDNLLRFKENSVHDTGIASRGSTKGVTRPEVKKDVKLKSTHVTQLDPSLNESVRVINQGSNNEVNYTDKQSKTMEDNGSESSESPVCNYQQGSTTFPRPKSFKVPSSNGAATEKKSRFLSLRFGSKKKYKMSKKKLKSFCSADASELCLDLTISSPTSPTDEKDGSFFTAAVPIIQAPPEEPLVPQKQVPEEPLSKSQEALFDDVNKEPFRNRSRSQPIRQTFSPTLCKEYEEIKESWGATYLEVPTPADQK